MSAIGGYSPEQRIATIVNSMDSNIGGRGITAKVFSVGNVDVDEFPQERVQIVLHSYERDLRLARDVEHQLMGVFDATMDKIKERYEDAFLEEMKFVQEGPDQVGNDALGFGYGVGAAGSFMVNADQYIRSYMVRVIRNFRVEVEGADDE